MSSEVRVSCGIMVSSKAGLCVVVFSTRNGSSDFTMGVETWRAYIEVFCSPIDAKLS